MLGLARGRATYAHGAPHGMGPCRRPAGRAAPIFATQPDSSPKTPAPTSNGSSSPPETPPATSASPAPPQTTTPTPRTTSSITALSRGASATPTSLLPEQLRNKIIALIGLIAVSRVGVYDRLPGVDIEKFSAAVSGSGLLGYIDNITGGSISNVGVFSLGIIPAINASIFLQIMSITFPSLKKMQREDGPQGRARYQLYTKLAALAFASVQAFGQLSALKPYVNEWSPQWLVSNEIALVAGAMIVNQVADYITELKLGNGTSILIFANIASYLPSSIGAAFAQAGDSGSSSIAIYMVAFVLTTYGIVCVQGAERRVPINYASRYRSSGDLARASYLPFKVNATGVMPVIFSTSLLAVPGAVARFSGLTALQPAAVALAPGGALYLPANVFFIAAINYYYTFLQLDPNDVSDQLKRQGASVPGVRPGRATAEFVTERLTNMSVLGSAFLGVLAAAPALTETLTNVPALRGFAGTSVLIIVGVATDTVRRIRAEKQMAKYGDVDSLYDKL
eukprot:jgi/Ulvmu1/8435/UM043_0013.1